MDELPIETEIKGFLVSTRIKVLAIKGAWGIGKTYTWNRCLEKAKREYPELKEKKYVYVSLFGINSLDDLKADLFSDLIKLEAMAEEGKKVKIKDRMNKLVSFAKDLPFIKNYSRIVERVAFQSIEGVVICIDDIERRGQSLSLRDVMGLISLLKEQRNCHILMLLNDGEEGLEDYRKYREKIVDKEISFSPEASYSAKIVFAGSEPYFAALKKYTIKLGINNMRTLKKIDDIVNQVYPKLTQYSHPVKERALQSLALFTWSHYSAESDDTVPDYDYLLQYDPTDGRQTDAQPDDDQLEDFEQKHLQWHGLLANYNYQDTQDFDRTLADIVSTGYMDEQALKREADYLNAYYQSHEASESFTNAMKRINLGFANNQAEIVKGVCESVKQHSQHLSPQQLNRAVVFLREMDENTKADDIIQCYITAHQADDRLFNTSTSWRREDLEKIDAGLKTEFDKIHRQPSKPSSLEEVFEKFKQHSTRLEDNDYFVLARTSERDFQTFFEKNMEEALAHFISFCLAYKPVNTSGNRPIFQAAQATERAQIKQTVTAVLQTLAAQNKLNRLRAKNVGISPRDETAGDAPSPGRT